MINWLQHFPHELAIIILAMLPLTELRAAIPVGIGVYKMTPWVAYGLSIFGNMIPIVCLFVFLPRLLTLLSRRSPRLHALLENYFFRLSKKHEQMLNTYGALFLFVFVAIPHPGGGVWSASALAILFRMKRPLAIFAIVCGTLVSGLIVLTLTLESIHVLKAL